MKVVKYLLNEPVDEDQDEDDADEHGADEDPEGERPADERPADEPAFIVSFILKLWSLRSSPPPSRVARSKS
jgi:hypothetical protein